MLEQYLYKIMLINNQLRSEFPSPETFLQWLLEPKKESFDKMYKDFSQCGLNNINHRNLLRELVKNHIASSMLDRFNYMFFTSTIYRISEIISISLQSRVNNTSWNKNIKILATCAISCTPYLLVYALGFNSTELIIASSLRFAVTYLPFVYNNIQCRNFIREIDLISSARNFSLMNFLAKNVTYVIRNLLVTYVLYETTLAYFFKNSSVLVNDKSIHENYAGAKSTYSIDLCPAITHQAYSTKYDWRYYVIVQLGWICGKILVDSIALVLKSIDVISDLRDPFIKTQSYSSHTSLKLAQETNKETLGNSKKKH